MLQGRGRICHFPIHYLMGLTPVRRYCTACDLICLLGLNLAAFQLTHTEQAY